ncbi:MAG: RIP metalloprotease RseP [Coprothermobacterota bacterium]|nr:RIP metalloprotease RseP [Coprothermobacterota bacterium]
MLTIWNILLAILVLGVLIFVHEMGHFLFAKRFRVPVEAFALGFGPAIFSFKRRETVYRLNVFPLGGYAKIVGMEGDEEDPRGFYAQSKSRRFLILAGGVLFNLVFAWVLILIVSLFSPTAANDTVVGEILPGYPAQAAGLQTGDKILSINGNAVETWDQERSLIEQSSKDGNPLQLQLDRGGQLLTFSVTPTYPTAENRWMLGLGPRAVRLPAGEAFVQSFVQYWRLISLVFLSLGMLITGQASIADLTGPVGIVQVTAQFSQSGFLSLLWFTSFLSINLGVLNLLPIPAFDGGRIIFLLIEAITGRRVNRRVEEMIHTVGFFLIIGLFLYITFQDIRRLW